jgi:hypothetical protein
MGVEEAMGEGEDDVLERPPMFDGADARAEHRVHENVREVVTHVLWEWESSIRSGLN